MKTKSHTTETALNIAFAVVMVCLIFSCNLSNDSPPKTNDDASDSNTAETDDDDNNTATDDDDDDSKDDDECLPDCGDRECGDDGCGGACGDCSQGFICTEGFCEPEIAPETDCSFEINMGNNYPADGRAMITVDIHAKNGDTLEGIPIYLQALGDYPVRWIGESFFYAAPKTDSTGEAWAQFVAPDGIPDSGGVDVTSGFLCKGERGDAKWIVETRELILYEALSESAVSLKAEPRVIIGDGRDTSTLTMFCIDQSGRSVHEGEVAFEIISGEATFLESGTDSYKTEIVEPGVAYATLSAGEYAGFIEVKAVMFEPISNDTQLMFAQNPCNLEYYSVQPSGALDLEGGVVDTVQVCFMCANQIAGDWRNPVPVYFSFEGDGDAKIVPDKAMSDESGLVCTFLMAGKTPAEVAVKATVVTGHESSSATSPLFTIGLKE